MHSQYLISSGQTAFFYHHQEEQKAVWPHKTIYLVNTREGCSFLTNIMLAD